MRIAGVVVLYNPDKKVNDNINSYIKGIDKLYIVDNSDIDNSNIIIKNKKIKYIANYDNLGIATALNIGAKNAIKDKFDFLLTMDQDSKFENNDIIKMVDMIRKYPQNSMIKSKFGNDLSKIGIFTPVHVVNNDPKILGVSDLEYDSPLNVMTSGNIINLKIYQEIGGFKDDFFIDCVDFDYCMNMRKHGYNLIRNNKIKLNHELGNYVVKSFLGRKYSTFEHNYIRRYYIIRNRHYLCDMYRNDFKEYCKLEKKCSLKEFKLVWMCEKNKLKKTWYMLKGYIDYKRGVKGKLK